MGRGKEWQQWGVAKESCLTVSVGVTGACLLTFRSTRV